MNDPGFEPLSVGPWRGLANPAYAATGLAQWFGPAGFPGPDFPGQAVEITTNIGSTFRLTVPGPEVEKIYYAKRFAANSLRAKIAGLLATPPAARTWTALLICREACIPAPAPVCIMAAPGHSVVITAAVPHSQDENLEYYFRGRFDHRPLPGSLIREKRELIALLAELFRLVHAQDRIYFPDFHPHNLVLSRPPDGPPRLYLVDFDEVRFRVRKDDRIKNLASLGRNAGKIAKRMTHPAITTGDRVRFLKCYLGPNSSPGNLQRLWREVLANWDRK